MNGNKEAIPPALLNEFFMAVLTKRFSDAERILQEIYNSIVSEGDEFKRGFLQALKGIILMGRSDNQHTFLNRLGAREPEALKRYYREFSENAKMRLHAPYDRGYFSALAEYIYFILKSAGLA